MTDVSRFAVWITRREAVSIQLRALYRDIAATKAAERQAKADAYNNSSSTSHGERQGIATHASVGLSTEVLVMQGQIDALEEERDFLNLCINTIEE